MDLSLIITILAAHFVADFIFQSESIAVNKYKSAGTLFAHASLYAIIMWLVIIYYFKVTMVEIPIEWESKLFYFLIITLATHGITDFFSSKLTHKFWEEKRFGSDVPNFGFFSIIGFDQLIHFVTLFLTVKYIILL